jgi:Ca-activated chloride channel homolog
VFHHGDGPVTLGLIVDRSQSTRPEKFGPADGGIGAPAVEPPEDELFAVTFNDRVSFAPPGEPFTGDVKALEAALTAVRAEGRTALYDGVAEGLLHLNLGHGEKRALIVVSDGGDNGSVHRYAEILALARRSDAVIYAIGLLGASPIEEEEDAGRLKRLCRDPGGVAYFPRTADEITAVSMRVGRDLREQYVLGFTPGAPTSGRTFRKLDVTVSATGLGRLHVRTRAGYETRP